MEQAIRRKKTGRYTPGALTSSKRKNRSLGRTRRKRQRAQRVKPVEQKSGK